MNTHTLTVLEYDALLASVCEQAQSTGGIALLKRLHPSNDLEVILSKRSLYQDLIDVRNHPLELPGLRTEELDELLRQVAPEGAVLNGPELVSCLSLLDVTADVVAFAAQRDCQPFRTMQALLQPLDPCNDLRQLFIRSLDRDGSVLDSASEKLRTLRREAASLEARIQRHLDQMVRSNEMDSTLQDRFVTTRNGRYVIPVKRDAKASIPGIVHDLSNTGQTLFVEPVETLGWGNDLVRTRSEERDEIIRILTDLSARLRTRLGIIMENQRILAELDAAAAIARWAGLNNCELVSFGRHFKLENARHPLLQQQFRREAKGRKVIPLNLEIPNGTKTIAITGSNTGGKTVVLKTVGLLCLAAQSGLPIPASNGTTLTIFDDVLADIGDEQSIAANLSTFSAHMKNVADILKESHHGRKLVLLDEIGGGTDPVEGGAIACGIIGNLAKCNTLTIATTHLALVKNFVHSQSNMLNASVRFDVKTLSPEYILDVGLPGASHALLIAQRLGLPDAVIADAKKMLTEDQRKLEDILTRMEADQRRIANHASKIAGTESDLTAKRDALAAELDTLRTQRRQLLQEAHQQADALVVNTRREMENLIRDIREQAKKAGKAQEAQKPDYETIRKAIAEKERKLKAGMKIHAEKQKHPLTPEELAVGLRVWVEKMQEHGIIESISARGNKVVVSINGIVVTLNANELEHNRDGIDKAPDEPVIKVFRPRTTAESHAEINLIGMRVEDALNELAPFIDRSVLLHMPELRIVHGFGTGRLRNGIHQWLRNNPSVKSFHLGQDGKDPGGGGCTIVTLN
ncbi:MAG: endonuclease MutS2 [Victivallales bacterium]|nr:endonuclease MutS2 [Victivallales bacterium]